MSTGTVQQSNGLTTQQTEQDPLGQIPVTMNNIGALLQAQRMARGSMIADWAKTNLVKQKFDLENAVLQQVFPGGQFGTIPYGNQTINIQNPALPSDPAANQTTTPTTPSTSPPTQSVPVPVSNPVPVVGTSPTSSNASTTNPLKSLLFGALGALGIGGAGIGGYFLNSKLPTTPTTPVVSTSPTTVPTITPAPTPGPIQIPIDIPFSLSNGQSSQQQQSTTTTTP
jgi:hypothetical protein